MESGFFGIEGTQAKISLGLGCNNDCLSCYNRFEKEAYPLVGEGRALELIDEAAASRADHLNLIGGEVTILPYFVRALVHARGRFPAISINTNGRRFSDGKFARASVAAGLTEVDVSLHGSSPEVHDAVSQAPGAFEETVRGLRNLVALSREDGPPLLSVSTIVLDRNLPDLVSLGRLLLEIGVPSWRVKYAYGALGGPVVAGSNDYIAPYGRALPVIAEVMATHGADLNIVVHDVPVCLLGDLFAFSTVQERHRVARYSAHGLQEVVRVLDRWGDSAPVCGGCAVRDRCCRPSPAYVERFGEGEFRPMTEEDLAAVRKGSEAFRTRLRETGAGPVRAAFESIDAAARAGRWREVRRKAAEVLELSPGDLHATRMRRMAEVHLLHEMAARFEETGELARARRTRLRIQAHYADLAAEGGDGDSRS